MEPFPESITANVSLYSYNSLLQKAFLYCKNYFSENLTLGLTSWQGVYIGLKETAGDFFVRSEYYPVIDNTGNVVAHINGIVEIDYRFMDMDVHILESFKTYKYEGILNIL